MCINSHSFPLSFASVYINPVGVFPGVTPVCMVPYGLYANKQELGFFFCLSCLLPDSALRECFLYVNMIYS